VTNVYCDACTHSYQCPHSCPQLCKPWDNSCSAALPTSEDCLYLNIWVPEHAKTDAPIPVLFLVHGGSFITGSASVPTLTGAWLARDAGCVVVMPNYRLSVLGFLAVDEDDGNRGWGDLSAALAWVHEHIAAFSGDVGRITVMGHSAGALSAIVLAHRHPTRVRALVLQSPPALAFTEPRVSQQLAQWMAKSLGCPASSNVSVCLSSVPVRQLLGRSTHCAMLGYLPSYT
jgi:para-nitrobenzyl esterase